MNIIKLNDSHTEIIKPMFFNSSKYMGLSNPGPYFERHDVDLPFNDKLHDIFCNQYLSNLKTFHAFGIVEDDKVVAFSAFHESPEEPCWFYTLYRGSGNRNHAIALLDKMMEHNEKSERYRYYTLINSRHVNLLRRFSYSSINNQRYDYYDDIFVPANTRCFYSKYWEILYNRSLVPVDTTVRCSFLKREYRNSVPLGGNL